MVNVRLVNRLREISLPALGRGHATQVAFAGRASRPELPVEGGGVVGGGSCPAVLEPPPPQPCSSAATTKVRLSSLRFMRREPYECATNIATLDRSMRIRG